MLSFREHLPGRIAAMGGNYRPYIMRSLLKWALVCAAIFSIFPVLASPKWDMRIFIVAGRAAALGLLLRAFLELAPRDVEIEEDRIVVGRGGGRSTVAASEIERMTITYLAGDRARLELIPATGNKTPQALGLDGATARRLEFILSAHELWRGKLGEAALANPAMADARTADQTNVLAYSTEPPTAKWDWSDFVFGGRFQTAILRSIVGKPSSETTPQGTALEATGTHWFTPRRAILLAAVMWAASLALPVWLIRSEHGENGTCPGLLPAMMGFFALVMWIPAWCSNFALLALGCRMFRGELASFWLAALAFAVALTAYFMPAIYGDNETGYIVGHRIGYYLWLGSFVVVTLAHMPRRYWERGSAVAMRWATLLILLLALGVLEYRFQRNLGPFETALRKPGDIKVFADVLARSPSQADKDAAMCWVMRQDVRKPVSAERFERLKKLLAAGANVNARYENKKTLLVEAVGSGNNEDLVELLINAGADVNADYWGRTAMDIATNQYSPASARCREILEKAGAKTSATMSKPAEP